MSEFLRCRDCKHDKGKCVGSSRRGSHKNCFEPREMTNADRIRAMSDEELAEFLILSPEMEFDVCRFCEYGNTSGDDRGICLTKDGICRAEANCAAFKKWLQQPAEEDT